MEKRRVKVSKERQIKTYSELRHASQVILEKAQKDKGGSFYQVMASLIFSAFMVEAYLNHIGPKIFECWVDLEPLSPLSKLDVVLEKLEIKRSKGERPYQTLSQLFKFRNALAHGKSVILRDEYEIEFVPETSEAYENRHEFLSTDWEKYCTQDNATRALKDTEAIIREIHEHTGTDERLFSFGMQGKLSRLLPDENSTGKP